MGTFYNSFCIRGDRREETVHALESWLALKGFVPSEDPLLFDLDGDNERHAFLIWNERWTVLLYSQYDEELRLMQAFCRADLDPLLYLWVYDGEVWGWDLCGADPFVASFSSDPEEHQSFSETPIGSERRPRGDARRLADALGLPDELFKKLRRLERRGSRRTEVFEAFCRRLGLEAAATTYDELESGILDRLDGWSVRSLLFVRRDYRESDADLRTYDPAEHRVGFWTPPEPLELSEELFAEIERMQQRTRRRILWQRPLMNVARFFRAARAYAAASFAAGEDQEIPPRPTFRRDGRDLVNDRHRCRITLAEGAAPISHSSKPSAVFGFRVGSVDVTCTARRLHQMHDVLRRPSRSRLIREEILDVDGLPARHLLFELPPGFSAGVRGESWLWIFVVQSRRGLYVFLLRVQEQLPSSQEAIVRRVVESLRFQEASAT